MAVFRTHKNKNYTTIHNGFLSNPNLSLKAKGLLAYFLSKPDDWEFYTSEIVKNSKDGRDSVTTAIEELEKAGYINRAIKRGSDGKFDGGYEYEVYETPQENLIEEIKPKSEKPKSEKPKSEKPKSEKPISENPTLLNTEYILNTNNTKYTTTTKYTNNTKYINKELNNVNPNQCTKMCSGSSDDVESNIDLVKLLGIKVSKATEREVASWDKERLIKSLEIFRDLDGQYFTFLKKIYNDERNFIKPTESSKSNIIKFAGKVNKFVTGCSSREYDDDFYEKLENHFQGVENE